MTGSRRLWSVTTLIDQGVPKPALLNWVGRTVAEYAVNHIDSVTAVAKDDPEGAIKLLVDSRFRKTARAAERGTKVHELAEQVAIGLDPDEDDFTPPHFEQYKRFLDDHRPTFLAAEAPVVNLTYGYAGTLDNIVEIGGVTCVLDVKTTDKGPDARSRPPYPEVALQLAAYAHAERICLTPLPRVDGRKRYYEWADDHPQEPMPQVDGALVLVLAPTDYILKPVVIDDTVWHAFLHAREVARWQIETSKGVFGPEIAPFVPLEQTVDAEAAELGLKVREESFGDYVERLRAEARANGGQAPALEETEA